MGKRYRARERAIRATEAEEVTKTEGGVAFPAAAYAYVPDAKSPSTWKIRIWESLDAKETPKQVGGAMAALSPGGFRGKKAQIPADALAGVKTKVRAAWKKAHPGASVSMMPATISEAINGEPTFSDIQEEIEDALEARLGCGDGCVWIVDATASMAIYRVMGQMSMGGGDYWRVGYTVDGTGEVTLVGDPVAVDQVTDYQPEDDSMGAQESAAEAIDHLAGRVLEARGEDADGGRVFAVQIIEHGTSRNGRRYPARVLSEAAHMYEGAKAFDHHRTLEELQTSTINGLVGQYRSVRVNPAGLEGELHLLPSATHTAESFDASLSAQSKGLDPLIGISHDVMAEFRGVVDGSQRIQEATKITRVMSADVVADPAAGGRAIRMVAGGAGDQEKGESMNLKQLLELLRTADAATRASLLTEHAQVLTDAGLEPGDVASMIGTPADAGGASAGGDGAGAGSDERRQLVSVGAGEGATESYRKESIFGRQVIRAAVAEAQLAGDHAVETVTKHLGERFTESDLETVIDISLNAREGFELDGMVPKVPSGNVSVGAEEHDKKVKRLDAFFEGNFQEGYHSFQQAYIDFTGRHPYAVGMDDFNRTVLRESLGDAGETYNSRHSEAMRAAESGTTSTWALTLGDSITRRMVAEYSRESLQDWKAIVSSTPPINDFRTQRLDRIGGYGTLPTVAQGAPYEPLTTPGEEEATYAVSKKGGTEDLTLEAIANDDVRWIVRIPTRLGLAAARTLRNAVWDLLATNATCSYDTVALFNSAHGNTTAVALSTSGYSQLRAKMRRQAGFGDTADVLGLTPRTLIVPPELEELGFELCTSDNAVPVTTPGATNVANLAKGTRLLVVDRLTDTNDWFLMADPGEVPTIEVGFYLGRQDPELFSQSDPLTGAVFNADKITYKIRHIWGLTIVDHRGFQTGTQ